MFADGGEDFAGDPTTELHCFWLVAADDDFVEAHLIDDRKLLRASKGVHRADTLHVFVEAGGNIPSVGVLVGEQLMSWFISCSPS